VSSLFFGLRYSLPRRPPVHPWVRALACGRVPGAVVGRNQGGGGRARSGPGQGIAAWSEDSPRARSRRRARALGPEGTLCLVDRGTGASNLIILCLKDPVFSRHQALYQTQFFYVLNSKLGKTMYPRCLVLDVAY
jgi:hypothetical protein